MGGMVKFSDVLNMDILLILDGKYEKFVCIWNYCDMHKQKFDTNLKLNNCIQYWIVTEIFLDGNNYKLISARGKNADIPAMPS